MTRISARVRAGITLVELLVALPIMGIVGLIAVLLLIAAERQARRADAVGGSMRELRHAAVIIGSDLRPLRPADLVAWTDTSLDFDATIGVGTACDVRGVGPQVNVLPAAAPNASTDPAGMRWIAPAQDGDLLTVWLAAAPPLAPTPWRSLVRDAITSNACAGSLLRSNGAAAVRLLLDDPLPSQIAEGTPVRLTRRTRLHHYRASDGFWYLGRRTRGRAVWDVTQPVAGPFASAALRGLRFAVADSMGSVLLVPGAVPPAAVRIELRAPRTGFTGMLDSTFAAVSLRGRDE